MIFVLLSLILLEAANQRDPCREPLIRCGQPKNWRKLSPSKCVGDVVQGISDTCIRNTKDGQYMKVK